MQMIFKNADNKNETINIFLAILLSISFVLLRILYLCFITANECTVTDFGMVHSFDGITQVVPPEFLSILTLSNLDPADPCNFETRIKTEVHVCVILGFVQETCKTYCLCFLHFK